MQIPLPLPLTEAGLGTSRGFILGDGNVINSAHLLKAKHRRPGRALRSSCGDEGGLGLWSKVRGTSQHVFQISLNSGRPCVVLRYVRKAVEFSGFPSLPILAPSLFATVRVFPQINYLRVMVEHKGKKKWFSEHALDY